MNQYEVHIVEPTDIDSIGFQSRRKGLEVRDCFLILEPSNKCRLGLLVRPELDTTVVESVVRGEGGVIEIDRCRVSGKPRTTHKDGNFPNPHTRRDSGWGYKVGAETEEPSGRFPSNTILKHGADCYCDGTKKVKPSNGSGTAHQDNKTTVGGLYGGVGKTIGTGWDPKGMSGTAGYTDEDGKEEVANWICEPTCPVATLDGQSGILKSPNTYTRKENVDSKVYGPGIGWKPKDYVENNYGDKGGASRFFKQVQSEDELDDYLNTLVRGDL